MNEITAAAPVGYSFTMRVWESEMVLKRLSKLRFLLFIFFMAFWNVNLHIARATCLCEVRVCLWGESAVHCYSTW